MGAGDRAPDFTLASLDGRSLRLADLRGKIVLLNFWATWCAPCRVETPWLVDFDRRYRSDGLDILGVSMDEGSRDVVASFVRDYRIQYPILMGNDVVAGAYGGVRFLPQTFLIDRDGIILARAFGIQQRAALEDQIVRALTRHPPVAIGTWKSSTGPGCMTTGVLRPVAREWRETGCRARR